MNQKFRDAIREVNLIQLMDQFRGTQYRMLVQKQMRELSIRLEIALAAGIDACTESEKKAGEILLDEYNKKGYEQSFWRRDTTDVFAEICNRSRELLSQFGAACEDKILFNMFQIVTMNLAAQVRDQKELRRFAGIRRSLFF